MIHRKVITMCLHSWLVIINRLLPKCNDRNKHPKRPFSLGKLANYTRKLANFGTFFGVKNVVNFSNSSRQYSVNRVKTNIRIFV